MACSSLLVLWTLLVPSVLDEPRLGRSGAAQHWPDLASAGRADRGFAFIENVGQWETDALYVGQVGGRILRAEPQAIALQIPAGRGSLQGVLLRMAFIGGLDATVEPLEHLPGVHHYYLGNDPTKWHRNARRFSRVRYRGVYEGIDLILGEEEGSPKYDLVFAPGADPSRVRIRWEGHQSLRVEADGSLRIETTFGTLLQPPGATWQVLSDGSLREVLCRYVQNGESTFGLEVLEWDPSLSLIVDPGLLWATYVGSSTNPVGTGDIARDVAIGPNGDVTITGSTAGAPDFPMTPGAYQSPSSGHDTFVTRLRAIDGSLVYSAVIGGSSTNDRAEAVRVDDMMRATVTGWTESDDFPTTPQAFMPSALGGAFVLRLTPSGDDLEYSTYLGGTFGAQAYALTVANSGSAIVGGYTVASDFPTSATAYDRTGGGQQDGFVTRLDPTGSSIEWSTYLGRASGPERVLGLVVNGAEIVTATGYTQSTNFPTTPGAFDTTYSGSSSQKEVFVTRFDARGSSLVWSTFLGNVNDDIGYDLALHSDGGVVVVGSTISPNFPTTPGAFERQHKGNGWPDAFVTRFNPSGSSLVYSTFLGSSGQDTAFGVAVDALGRATVTGFNAGDDFPITPDAFATRNASREFFLTRFDPSGSRLVYSTYIGSNSIDDAWGLAMTSDGRLAAVAGISFGADFPTTPGSAQPTFQGGQSDAVVATFVFENVASPTGGFVPRIRSGPVSSATIERRPGERPRLVATCSQAPAEARGWLVIGTFRRTQAQDQMGSRIEAAPPRLRLPVRVDANGYVESALELLLDRTGSVLYVQFVFETERGANDRFVTSTLSEIAVP